MHEMITNEEIRRALYEQSIQKAPSPERLGFRAITLLWE